MADWVRDKALMQITSSLGVDALIPTYLVADEQISQPFNSEIMAVSQVGVIDPNNIFNPPLCVIPRDADRPLRRMTGRCRADRGAERA